MSKGKHPAARSTGRSPTAVVVALLVISIFPVALLMRTRKVPEPVTERIVAPAPAQAILPNRVPSSKPGDAGPEKLLLLMDAVPPAASNASLIDSDLDVSIDKSVEHLTRGNSLLGANKLAEAIREYRLAAEFNPEDEDVFYNLGLALARAGDLAAARKAYEMSLELYPDYVEAHNNLGNLLVRAGNLDEAITHFEAAIELDPNHATANNNLGNALARKGEYGKAVPYFEKAIEANPDYLEAQVNLGNAYLLLNRTSQALQQFSNILAASPDFEPARKGHARAMQQRGSAPHPITDP